MTDLAPLFTGSRRHRQIFATLFTATVALSELDYAD
jgi:hypothetical protein